MVSEESDIRESLFILLSTKPGERIMHPEYGCNLRSLVFEVINETTLTQIKKAIEKAILYFEPRITLEQIEIEVTDQLEGKVNINLLYTIRKTNTRSNMVYPYYLIEGTEVKLLK